MKNEDYFLLKEIILGLRSEYQENQKKLNELKKLVTITDNDVENYNFFVKREDNNYYMILNIMKKQNAIQKLLENINYKLTDKKALLAVLINYVNLERKDYFICNDQNKLYIPDSNKFYAEMDHILLNDFNSGLSDKYKEVKEEDMSIKVSHNGVFSLTTDLKPKCTTTGIDYHACNDTLSIIRYYESFPKESIDYILNSGIPKNYLSDYTRNVIENSEDASLPIVFEGLDCSKDNQIFKFEKDNNKMYLRRIK